MTYKVSLIPPNLRKNETIVQIADSLDYLSKVIDDIMQNIEKRVDKNSNKLDDITNRIDVVNNKISQLRKVKNAVQVFSCSKYPAAEMNEKYVSIFPTHSEIPKIKHKVSAKYPLKRDDPLEKLHIYHVQVSKIKPDKIEGLGKIPNDINCVNDLLLYNCGKNLYKEFIISDSLQIIQKTTKNEENKILIGEAPASMADKNSFSNIPSETYFYSPDLGEVPALDIPLDLPDLPGIAGNVRYNEDASLGIAPSVMSPTISKNIEDTIQGLEDLPEILPSPPSPPHREIEKLQQNVSIQEQTKSDENPKELSVEKSETDSNKPKTEVVKQVELPAIPDARASLMEAIRKAGGAKKLKSVVKEDSPTKNGKGGGDLMADLHAKLTMRRKGISGTPKNTDNLNLDSRTTLSLMSSLIPPPEETYEASTDADEEWE